MIEELQPGAEDRLDAFLRRHADTSMFLRGNLHAGGLGSGEHPYKTRYFAAAGGAGIDGVIGLTRNGMLMIQAPGGQAELCDFVRGVLAGERPAIQGISGAAGQVRTALPRLGLAGRPTRLDHDEILYGLTLDDLIVPEQLASGRCRARRAGPADRGLLVAWRRGYEIEALGAPDTAETTAKAEREADAQLASGQYWILRQGGRPVSYSGFNAAVADMVQVGGVWTPVAERGRGYARAVVAASLDEARRAGVGRAVLFTDAPAGARAYEAIGFRQIGAFAIVLFETPEIP